MEDTHRAREIEREGERERGRERGVRRGRRDPASLMMDWTVRKSRCVPADRNAASEAPSAAESEPETTSSSAPASACFFSCSCCRILSLPIGGAKVPLRIGEA